MHSIKLMTVEEILKDSSQIIETIQKAFDHCGLKNGWSAVEVVQYSVGNPLEHHLWKVCGDDGFAVAYFATRTFSYPNGVLELNVLALANVYGDPSSFKHYGHLTEDLEVLAKEKGFNKIGICGRMGWKKVMKPMGYDLDYCTFSKDLGERNDKDI